MTWYPESFTNVPMNDMHMRADRSREYPGRTYRFYTGKRVFEFGYGLSFSNYSYKLLSAPDRLSLSESESKILQKRDDGFQLLEYIHVDEVEYCDSLRFFVQISVTNHGDMDGSHVVMLFSKLPKNYIGAPEKQLIGFDRVHTTSHRNTETSFLVEPCKHLSFINEHGKRVLPLGDHALVLEDLQHIISIER